MNKSKLSPHFKEYGHLLIAAGIGFTILLGLAPANGLTREGVMLLAIVAPTIYMWLFVNTHWVSLLFLALLVMTGIMSPNQVWAGSLGHFSIMLVLTFSIISECLNENGVIEKIANWFITRKFVQGRPYAFIGMYVASNLIIGIFMQNLALAVIFVALTRQICERLGVKKGDSLYTCLMLGTFWGNVVLSISSPIAKSLPNILIGLVYANFGIQITYAQWLMVGMPFKAGMFVIIMLCIRIANPNTEALKNLDVLNSQQAELPLSTAGRVSLCAMIGLILFILLPEIFLILHLFTGVSTYLVQLGVIVPAIVTIVALCIIQVKDKEKEQWVPVMAFAQVAKKIPINLLLFVSVVVIMGVPLSADETGIIPWMQHLLSPLTDGLTPFLLLSALLIIAVIITNFISTTVVITVFVSLGVAIFSDHAISPVVYSVLVSFAAGITALTPAATITAPIFYGPNHIKVREVAKINLLFITLASIVLFAMIPLVMAVID
ncbi:MAG: SLC13 family permease [Turicibacter sp.]|nr:SLC13 family permease [Turicibacter sp.]